jgi:predicted SnoaL-like aldol condensation-catalyzing enzyme
MQYFVIFSLFAIISAAVSSVVSNCPPQPAGPEQQKAIFEAFVKSYYVDKDLHGSYGTFFADDFIQHSPAVVGNGRKNTTDWLTPYWSCLEFKVVRSVFADSVGVAHVWEARNSRYHTMAEFFRMDGTCIVEHWDVMQDFPADAKNPLAMLNGQTLPVQNRTVGCGFVSRLLLLFDIG